jgi:hypothetical protein
VDDVEPFVAAEHRARADGPMPGVGEGRADAGGPPGRWNLVPHFVWTFTVREDTILDTGPPLVQTRWGLRVEVERAAWQYFGRDGAYWQRVTFHRLDAPFWVVVALLALPAAARLCVTIGRAALRRPPTPGLCPTCNYDLRATPDRCPECGRHAPDGVTPGTERTSID